MSQKVKHIRRLSGFWKCFSRERQRKGKTGGGGGGGQNLTRRPLHGKQFPTPPHLDTFPRPNAIYLMKSLTNSQKFPQVTPSKTVFRGSPKIVFKGPSSRDFAPPPPPCFAPPPFGSAQFFFSQKCLLSRILYNSEILESAQIVENKGESDRFLDFLRI